MRSLNPKSHGAGRIAVYCVLALVLFLTVGPDEKRRKFGAYLDLTRQQEVISSHQLERAKRMPNKEITPAELLEMLERGREMGFVSGDLPEDPAERELLAQSILENIIYQGVGENEQGYESGRQQLTLKGQLDGPWNEATDRHLPLILEGPEWTELFRNVLRSPLPELMKPGEDFDEYRTRQGIRFRESLPDFPMLGRIWDTYIDVGFNPGEVSQLRDECLKLRATTSNALALQALDKLANGCEEALKHGTGLLLVSD